MSAIRRKYRADDFSRAAAAILSASVTASSSGSAVVAPPQNDANVVMLAANPAAQFPGADATASAEFVVKSSPDKWTQHLEKRFAALAKMVALEKASDGELAEFSQLRHWRRQLRCPPTIEEIEFQLKQRRVERKVREALLSYVEFTRWQNTPRSGA